MRTPTIATLIALVLLLTGCIPQQAPPEPTPTPVSELEALTSAYLAYQSAIDLALSNYDAGSLEKVATGAALEAALESVESFKTSGRRQVGLSAVDSLSVSSSFQIHACLDVGDVDVVNVQGESTLQPDRATRFPMVVTFSEDLLVMNEEIWLRDDFC